MGVNVHLVSEPLLDIPLGRDMSGVVTTVKPTHGFISLDAGGAIFFHKDHCGPGTPFEILKVNDRVKCTTKANAGRKLYADNVELYSGAPIK